LLPFLKHKQDAAGSASHPVEVRKHDEDFEYDSLHSAAHDLMMALEAKDASAIAQALRAAFEICDSEPHIEGPHHE
jgi:hypothetical protein